MSSDAVAGGVNFGEGPPPAPTPWSQIDYSALWDVESVDDLAAAARELRDLRQIITDLRRIESLLTSQVVGLMDGRRRVSVEGVGTLEARGGRDRKNFDHKRLLSIAAARAADEVYDRETGEIPPIAVIAEHVAEVVTEMAHVDYWRKGACAERGIKLDDFCTSEPGRTNVVIT